MLHRRNASKGVLGLLALAVVALGAHGCSSSDDGGSPGCEGAACEQTGIGTVEVGEPCDETQECVPGSVCFNKYCVGSGTLRVSLAFSVDSDFDLHVLTPGGSEIYWLTDEANGGRLDVDQCVASCEDGEPHVENVVFDESALSGEYQVWVVNFDGRAAGDFRIEVAGDVSASFEGSLPAGDPFEELESMRFSFTL
jgi:hypothetical protein